MKKRLLAVIFTFVFAVSAVTGCGNSDKKANGKHQEYVPTEQDLSKIKVGNYDWPVDQAIDYTKSYNKRFDGLTFTMAVNGNGSDLPEGMTIEENTWTWYLEGRVGLKMKALWTASGSAYTAKLNQAITSNEIPDLMYVDLNQYRTLVKAGLIADLTEELLEEEHPTIQEIYAKNNNRALDAITIDGRIYGIPHVSASYDSTPLVWIRTDWLKKLGLEEPKTISDLEKIATAFMEKDPDGNGRADTYGIPMTTAYGAGGEGSFNTIFLNVGGAVPGTWQKQKDGTLIYGSLMDGAKEALTLLNDWYKKGIIPEDFATWDTMAIEEAVGADQAGIVFAPWYAGVLGLNSNIVLNESAEWSAYLLPEEEGGEIYAAQGDPLVGIYVVSKDFAYPEAFVYAYDMMESYGNKYNSGAPDPTFLYRDCEGYDGSVSSAYNPVGSALPSDYYTLPLAAIYENAESAGGLNKLTSVDDVKKCLEGKVDNHSLLARIEKETYPALDIYFAEQAGKNVRQVAYGNKSALDTYQLHLLYYEGPNAIRKGNPIGRTTEFMGLVPSMELYSSFLSNFELEAYTKMIMGETDGKSISAYFDAFVKDYLKQGGKEIAKEVNEEYGK